MSKITVRQYSTDDHDSHTITLEEYNRLNKTEKMKPYRGVYTRYSKAHRVYLHQSTYAGEGDKVW